MITTAILIFLYHYFFGDKSDEDTEHNRYHIVDIIDGLEIRKYNSAIYAGISLRGNFKDQANKGFRALAAYIFGANTKKEKISMTVPIRLRSDGLITEISLRMPAKYNLHNLPQPNNQNIKIKSYSHGYCAVISFGGFSPSWRIQRKLADLKYLLEKNNIDHNGGFEYLSYNPPYKLKGRRNEIVVHLADRPKLKDLKKEADSIKQSLAN